MIFYMLYNYSTRQNIIMKKKVIKLHIGMLDKEI